MRIEDEVILEFCKRDMDSELVRFKIAQANFKWDYFLRAAAQNKVRLYILDRLDQATRQELFAACVSPINKPPHGDLQIPAAIRSGLVDFFTTERKAAARRELMRSELLRVGDRLREEKLEFVLMKGLSFDHADLREFSDLDLLVRSDDLVKSVHVLDTLGYEFKQSPLIRNSYRSVKESIKSQLSWNNEFLVFNRDTNLLVELHTNLFHRENVYSEDLNRLWAGIGLFWDESRYDDRLGCRVFSRDCLVILMCLHAAIKRSPARNTFQLRILVDIDRTCQVGVSWDHIVVTSHMLGVSPFVFFSLELSATLLGTEVPADVLQRLREDCRATELKMCHLHRKCLISLVGSSPVRSIIYRIACPFVFGARWKDRIKWALLIPILFPSRFNLAKRFHLREKSPFVVFYYLLNPFHRIYKALSRMRRR